VAQRYAELLALSANSSDGGNSRNPFNKLGALKAAMREISDNIHIETQHLMKENTVAETEDELGWTMRCLRAYERGHFGTVRRALRAYPKLQSFIRGYDGVGSVSIRKLRDHAMNLARIFTLEELRAIQEDEGKEAPGVQSARRQKVQARLKTLRPGSCNSIAALQTADGHIIAEPAAIATELQRYWKDVFSAKAAEQSTMCTWFTEELGSGGPWTGSTCSDWEIQRCSMRRAIQKSSKSAPGPDGIPYLAWKRLGLLGEDILLEVARFLGESEVSECSQVLGEFGSHLADSFNLGNMVFLPKKLAGTDPVMGDFYTPADVRPLLIVNTDNRLIANSMRLQWEPTFESWISPIQQGFLPGRSMADNILQVDAVAQRLALSQPRAGIMLLDFRAAFPSVGHDFLHKSLTALGLPSCLRRSIRNLYCNHTCNISLGGGHHQGFGIGAGIRQGCPLSPVLFALIIDIVLRRIQRLIPTAVVKAFADDIAIVLDDVGNALHTLGGIYADLAKFSGLVLNIPKCVLVPLWVSDAAQISRELVTSFSQWANISVAYHAKYLGVLVGPTSVDTFWDHAIKKYLDRAKQWGKLGLGLQFAAVACKTYVLPTLGFLAQFKRPSQKVLEAETKALAFMGPGPYKWCTKEDLYHCHESWGQQVSFPNVEDLCLAARCRLMQFENCAHGGGWISRAKKTTWVPHCRSWIVLVGSASGTPGTKTACLLISTPARPSLQPRACQLRRFYGKRSQRMTRWMRQASSDGRKNIFKLPSGPSCTKEGRTIRLKDCVTNWTDGAFLDFLVEMLYGVARCSGCFTPAFLHGFVVLSGEHFSTVGAPAGGFRNRERVAFARRRLNIHPASWERCLFITLDSIKGTYGKEDLARHALWVYAVYKAHNFLRYRPLDEDSGCVGAVCGRGYFGSPFCDELFRWGFSYRHCFGIGHLFF